MKLCGALRNMIELIPAGGSGAARREWTGAAVLWAFLSLPARVRRRAATATRSLSLRSGVKKVNREQ